ncbi:triose-phosphate isomerase [Candidatus Nanohalococcus occultus]|uniref:triose-phosphate isomerase n=1 Tax=Candidatus Nanohalococcus occultus TaxID=2978047 RepID=UPI0039E13D85
MIVVNFKTYSESTGEKADSLAEKCSKARKESGENVIIAPQSPDLLRAKDKEIEVFGQHLDPVNPGSHTGHSLAKALKAAGASGTLINHSERRLKPEKIRKTIEKANEAGLTSIVCAQSPEECEKFSEFDPDYVAFEPPELIGGDVSVSEAKPELIEEAVERSKVDLLTGAGVKTSQDVEKSMEIGCKGVLVASGVVKSEDSYSAVMELCEGL